MIIVSIAIISTGSKLYEKAKTNNLHNIPNKANVGIVDKKAKIEVSAPLYTSMIQFAKGNIANFDISPTIIIITANEYSNELSLFAINSKISVKLNVLQIPYKYDVPNKNTAVDIADVIKYLKQASFEKYPFLNAIKRYVGKANNSIDINNVRKSFEDIISIAPSNAVKSKA